jgi:hypothetical protein
VGATEPCGAWEVVTARVEVAARLHHAHQHVWIGCIPILTVRGEVAAAKAAIFELSRTAEVSTRLSPPNPKPRPSHPRDPALSTLLLAVTCLHWLAAGGPAPYRSSRGPNLALGSPPCLLPPALEWGRQPRFSPQALTRKLISGGFLLDPVLD